MITPYVSGIVKRVAKLRADYGIREKADLKNSRRWVNALKKGRTFFYERQEVEIGLKQIDWTGSHIKHQEWRAQLNRFPWLGHLAAVYRATGDPELPALARATIEDWIDQHTYAADRPIASGDNTLNLSLRLGQSKRPGWWGTLPAFAASTQYDAPFIRRMAASTLGQLDLLAAHLSPLGNWRVSQLDCMLFCSLTVPGAGKYAAFAVRQLNVAFRRQIHNDGSHEEHNPSYHGWMCRLFTSLWRLGQARPRLGLHIDTERAARMWDYLVCATAPDGGSAGLHDSVPWQRPVTVNTRPHPIAALADRDRFLKEAGLAHKRAWSLTRQPSRWFPDAGQMFLRDSWKPDASFLTFDATRWGGSHCHLSRLSVNLFAGDRMLLCDPGLFSYEMSDPYAAYGKSTPAHNTITVGGRNQTEANPDTRTVFIGRDFAFAASRYAGGYVDGTYTWWWAKGHGNALYGSHDRMLLWIKGRCALVFDLLVTNGGNQPIAAHWQLPRGTVRVDHARRRAWTRGKGYNVLLQHIGGNCLPRLAVREGGKNPLLGWLPITAGQYDPAPLLAFKMKAAEQWIELVTLLVPFKGNRPPSFAVHPFPRQRGGPFGFRLAWPDGVQHIVAATPAAHAEIGAFDSISTDGSLAVIDMKHGRPRNAFVSGGTILRHEGRVLIDRTEVGNHEG